MGSWDFRNTLWKQGVKRAKLGLGTSEVLSYTPFEKMFHFEEEEVTSKYRPHYEVGKSSTCPLPDFTTKWFDLDDDDDDMPGLNFDCLGVGCGCDLCLWDLDTPAEKTEPVKGNPNTSALEPAVELEPVEPVKDNPSTTSSQSKSASNRGSASMTI